jgi:hypothetical protein
MNEQIRELYTQVCMEQNLPFTLEHNGAYMLDAFADKFAELIVRECLNVMSKTSEEANKRFTYMGDDVPTVVHQMNIEKHFGVEE